MVAQCSVSEGISGSLDGKHGDEGGRGEGKGSGRGMRSGEAMADQVRLVG